MLRSFARAFAQLDDPAFRRPLWGALALAACAFALLWAALGWLLVHTTLFEIAWLDGALRALGGLAAFVLTVILFPAVAAASVPLFLDPIAAAVDARHYPHLPVPRRIPLREQALDGARFAAVAVALNLAALPLYLVPALNVVVFYGVNGYLLGREYFETVAARRLDAAARKSLWRRRRGRFILSGAAIALFSTVPLANLLAPVVAVAAMVHLVENWRREG